MKHIKHTVVSAALVGVLVAPGVAASASPLRGAASTAKTKRPLGDLSKFQKITTDTLAFVKSGDMKKAEKRITDMETKWDAYENALKARDKTRWTQLDTALDKVLKALRASKPDPAASTTALQDMLTLINSMS
jgi:hypothetical protein